MIQYLNLIWEEQFLVKWSKIPLVKWRMIPRHLWLLWLPEIKIVFASEFAKKTIAKYDFHFPPDFTDGS